MNAQFGPGRETSSQTSQPANDTADGGESNGMELEQIKSTEDELKLPLHEDIMQLAMLGEISPLQKLLDDGKYSIVYRDKEDITPLHV